MTVRAPRSERKRLRARRTAGDSQRIRRVVQVAFLLLNVWIGAQFYVFVRYYESGGATAKVSRPPGVEGWLPIAALMNLKYAAVTGSVPEVHSAGLFLLVAFLAISLLLRKAFCSWLCPIGTISEWLWQGGQELFGKSLRLPRWLDVPLRGVKYILLGLFVYAVGTMSAEAISAFIRSPYGLVADVKMLDFFRRMGPTAAAVIGALFVLSVPIQNFWCRYLCPYGAMVGLVALVSPLRIRRESDLCIDCAKCAKACPSLLPVDRVTTVKSAECTACLLCVEACPAAGALQLSAPRKRTVPAWAVAAAIAVIFFGVTGYARLAGHWHTELPDPVYFELIPKARSFGHP